MGSPPGRNAIVLALAMVGGCDVTTAQRLGGARILTAFEMDQVTAGSAGAANSAAARGVGYTPDTAVLGTASAYSGNNSIASAPFLDYAASQATASANGSNLAQTSLSSQISVDGVNGGVSINARASGTGMSQAQVTTQFYGISTNRADFAFGSVAAVACCGTNAAAQVEVDGAAGGLYSRGFRGMPVSSAPGQAQSRLDIAVTSSALPLVDPAQMSVADAPSRVSPKY
jgi:hypothetical protein